jgi:hypothetical protein
MCGNSPFALLFCNFSRRQSEPARFCRNFDIGPLITRRVTATNSVFGKPYARIAFAGLRNDPVVIAMYFAARL